MQLLTQSEPLSHVSVQLPPEHLLLQFAPDLQTTVQLPPEQSFDASAPSSAEKVQRPPGQSFWQAEPLQSQEVRLLAPHFTPTVGWLTTLPLEEPPEELDETWPLDDAGALPPDDDVLPLGVLFVEPDDEELLGFGSPSSSRRALIEQPTIAVIIVPAKIQFETFIVQLQEEESFSALVPSLGPRDMPSRGPENSEWFRAVT